MEVTNQYPKHHHTETWIKQEGVFCPECGKKGFLWTASEGDYYWGRETICTACSTSHYLEHGFGDAKASIVEQLKTGKTHKPLSQKPKSKEDRTWMDRMNQFLPDPMEEMRHRNRLLDCMSSKKIFGKFN